MKFRLEYEVDWDELTANINLAAKTDDMTDDVLVELLAGLVVVVSNLVDETSSMAPQGIPKEKIRQLLPLLEARIAEHSKRLKGTATN